SAQDRAAPASNPPPMKGQVNRANALFQIGKVKEALELYEKAYQLKAHPAILFNIAQCHRELKEYQQAVRTYEANLVAFPDSPKRVAVEALIKELQELLKKEEATKAQPPKGPDTGNAPPAPALLPRAAPPEAPSP